MQTINCCEIPCSNLGFKHMLFCRNVAASLVILLMTACAPLRQQPTTFAIDPDLIWQERQIELRQLTKWEIRGRTAITQGDEAWNAGLNWRENTGIYRIKLMGPFSQGGIHLDGTPEQVVLTLSDGEMIAASTPEALLTKTFNLKFPISALRDWVRGLPFAGSPYQALEIDDQGRLKRLEQQEWTINYQRYETYGQQQMPAKIFISHPEFSLRLVVNNWKDVQ
jgi:outer membrane lipoprotein LolB